MLNTKKLQHNTTILSKQFQHFARFHDLSRQVRDKLAMNSELLARETATIQARVESCTVAIHTDIGDNARMIYTKFENCLNSGA